MPIQYTNPQASALSGRRRFSNLRAPVRFLPRQREIFQDPNFIDQPSSTDPFSPINAQNLPVRLPYGGSGFGAASDDLPGLAANPGSHPGLSLDPFSGISESFAAAQQSPTIGGKAFNAAKGFAKFGSLALSPVKNTGLLFGKSLVFDPIASALGFGSTTQSPETTAMSHGITTDPIGGFAAAPTESFGQTGPDLPGLSDVGPIGQSAPAFGMDPGMAMGLAESLGIGSGSGNVGGNVGGGIGTGLGPSEGSAEGALGGGDDSGDDSVICTELHRQGLLSDDIYKIDSLYGKTLDPAVLIGYHLWGKPLAKLMRKSKFVTWMLKSFAISWAHNIAGKSNTTGKVLNMVGVPLCRALGNIRKFMSSEVRKCQVKYNTH